MVMTWQERSTGRLTEEWLTSFALNRSLSLAVDERAGRKPVHTKAAMWICRLLSVFEMSMRTRLAHNELQA
jgi:hypothetical protein